MKTYDEFRLPVARLLFLEPLAAAVRAVLVRTVRFDVAVRAAVRGHDGGTDERVFNSGEGRCADEAWPGEGAGRIVGAGWAW